MSNSPAFQYYPADLLTDPEVMLWNMKEVGAYWMMISYLWLNGGFAEDSDELRRTLFRVRYVRTSREMWSRIKGKFIEQDGKITHKRVLREMQKQVKWNEKSREGGLKSWQTRKVAGEMTNRGWVKGGSGMVRVNGEPKTNSSSSSSPLKTIYTYTIQQVKDSCNLNGIPESNAQSYFDQYNSQDWRKANGQPITNLQSHTAKRWNKVKQCWDFDEKKEKNGRTRTVGQDTKPRIR